MVDATRRDALALGVTAVAASAVSAAPATAAHAPAGVVTALGWYVTFAHPTQLDAMEAHYRERLRLPLYRRWRVGPGERQSKDHFWLGEAAILDLSYQGKVIGERARQAAVFRVRDVDAIARDVRARGAAVSAAVDGPWGREAFVTDPMGQQIGLRAGPPRSSLPADREARRRAARGEAFNPGCGSLPAGWQELGWVQLRAADPARLARFYQTALGLPPIARRAGSILLDLGDAVTLEIVGGGATRPAPAEQYAATAATILRVRGLEAAAARLFAARAPLVGKRYSIPLGDFFYIADPEGNVVGLAERRPPGTYAAQRAPVPEDLEAQRRAVEAQAASRSAA